jgi:hypothetical protein
MSDFEGFQSVYTGTKLMCTDKFFGRKSCASARTLYFELGDKAKREITRKHIFKRRVLSMSYTNLKEKK